jgi:anaerobic selenocysteine-containing dehydrogenase
MHPDDLHRMGLEHDQLVTVSSSTGSMRQILARGYQEIRSGSAMMYYPESNVLVPRVVDPKSRTPMFKNILVTITKEN